MSAISSSVLMLVSWFSALHLSTVSPIYILLFANFLSYSLFHPLLSDPVSFVVLSPLFFTLPTLFLAIIFPCVCKFYCHVIGLGFSRNSKVRVVYWNILKQYIRILCIYDTSVRVVSVLFRVRKNVITGNKN